MIENTYSMSYKVLQREKLSKETDTMLTQNMLRKYEVKGYFLKKNIRFVTAHDLNKFNNRDHS